MTAKSKTQKTRTVEAARNSSKYRNVIASLEATGRGSMKCFGNSMRPILPNPSTCDYEVADTYEIGDIVFCKVRGRYIDAHKITKVAADGQFMIANNHGHENGWTRTIYGRVVRAFNNGGIEVYTRKGK